jgi:hypothetical protein
MQRISKTPGTLARYMKQAQRTGKPLFFAHPDGRILRLDPIHFRGASEKQLRRVLSEKGFDHPPDGSARLASAQDAGYAGTHDGEFAKHRYQRRPKAPKAVPADATFGLPIRVGIVKVLHPPTGRIHRVRVSSDTDVETFRRALSANGYQAHPREAKVWAAMMNAHSHKGRGIHVLHAQGFYRDNEHTDNVKFERGGKTDDSDVSVERDGKLITNPAQKKKILKEVGE